MCRPSSHYSVLDMHATVFSGSESSRAQWNCVVGSALCESFRCLVVRNKRCVVVVAPQLTLLSMPPMKLFGAIEGWGTWSRTRQSLGTQPPSWPLRQRLPTSRTRHHCLGAHAPRPHCIFARPPSARPSIDIVGSNRQCEWLLNGGSSTCRSLYHRHTQRILDCTLLPWLYGYLTCVTIHTSRHH